MLDLKLDHVCIPLVKHCMLYYHRISRIGWLLFSRLIQS